MEEKADWNRNFSLSLKLSLTALLIFGMVPASMVAQTTPPSDPERVVISISPQFAAIPTEGTQQFTATVRGASNDAVIWLVNGVIGGNPTVGTSTTSDN